MTHSFLSPERLYKPVFHFILGLMVDETIIYIEGLTDGSDAKYKFVLKPANPVISLLMLINPNYWIAEAYSRGYWSLSRGDLGEFVSHAARNAHPLYQRYLAFHRSRTTFLHIVKQRIFHRFFTRKVKSHYELDPEIYSQFLDSELVYTCAFFGRNDNLESAQHSKFLTILQRLELENNIKPNVLNIGCGWGSFERFLVRNHNRVCVTGLSISSSQVKWADSQNKKLLKPSELRRLEIREQDYIDHSFDQGYDAITAIGMVEHVGQAGYAEFFGKTCHLLKEQGTLLIHMIVKPKSNEPTNRWIDKYIFPGGYAPSVSELTMAAESQSMRIKNIHIHHPKNYQRTLIEWRGNLSKNRSEVIRIYSKKFGLSEFMAAYYYRQWEFYLAGSESVFARNEAPHQVAHFVFEKSCS